MADLKNNSNEGRMIAGSAFAGLVTLSLVSVFVYNTVNEASRGDLPLQAPIQAGPGDPAAPNGGAPPPPGAPGAPGAPGGAPAAAPKVSAPTSWDKAPASYGAGAAAGGQPAAPAGGGSADTLKAPIHRGVKPANRSDPFVSYHIIKLERPPAFSLVAPLRLASYPKPATPNPSANLKPDELYGPLPHVDRRVAGVLYDGSVSAILETGTPGGASTDVSVVMPGQTVPSGIPGIENLTVSSITPTGVLLRAADGRTVEVKLSNVPAAYADAFHQALSNGQQPGAPGDMGPDGPPPGVPGPGGRFPRGGFGPGGPAGP